MSTPGGEVYGPNDIEKYLPHRPPMRLVDEVIRWEDDRLIARKKFSSDEYFFAGHYPDFPLVPGVILCECALQAGALLLARRLQGFDGSRVPVVTRMNNVRFKRMVRPGEIIEIDVSIKDQISGAYFLTGKVQCAGQLAVWLEFACALADKEQM